MGSIANFVSKNSIENDRNHCKGEKNHSTKETFDGCMTIDHEDVFCRCFIRYSMSKCFPNIFPNKKEYLDIESLRMHRSESEIRRTHCETHETEFDCTWI
jgi:hypothetical protein